MYGSFFGLEFALSGYNILYGFPKEGGRDPGWRPPIFEANFDDSRYTSDCSYELPRGIDMQRTVACSTSFTSKGDWDYTVLVLYGYYMVIIKDSVFNVIFSAVIYWHGNSI